MDDKLKTSPDHPSSMEARITKRLRNSGGEEASTTVQKGEGPTRTFSNIWHGGTARKTTNKSEER
jgi:hypothetical protein